MKVLFDTSVLVAALVAAHPMHVRAFPWLRRAKERRFEYLVSAHSLLELYAVLSRLPVSPRIAPSVARRLIDESVVEPGRIVALTTREYVKVLRQVAELGLTGGVVYDALVAEVARKEAVDRLLTLNLGHFERAWPAAGPVLTVP